MGQYYHPVFLNAEGNVFSLPPHDYDNGSKLMEHSWIGNNLVNAAYTLLQGARWRVAWMGDYANDGEEEYTRQEEPYQRTLLWAEFISVYDEAWGGKDGMELSVIEFGEEIEEHPVSMETTGLYLADHDQKLYLDLKEYIDQNKYAGGPPDDTPWCVNPLPLLTACGNGRGGGDYGGEDMEHIGSWAFHWLELVDTPPEGYTKAAYHFRESR